MCVANKRDILGQNMMFPNTNPNQMVLCLKPNFSTVTSQGRIKKKKKILKTLQVAT